MTRYRYDGGFEGFLCALGRALDAGSHSPLFEVETVEQGGLFGEIAAIPTEREVALAFRERFVAATSREAFATLRHAFHAGVPGVEGMLWEYVRLGLERGEGLNTMIADQRVNRVERLARAVARETHRYLGFVRFRELKGGLFYARIEPEHHILPFLAPHFVRRLADRSWMIHDLRRSSAALHHRGRWQLVGGITLTGSPDFSDGERELAGLWRRYFRRLAIGERGNRKLQQQNVPLRSRTHLVEFEDT